MKFRDTGVPVGDNDLKADILKSLETDQSINFFTYSSF